MNNGFILIPFDEVPAEKLEIAAQEITRLTGFEVVVGKTDELELNNFIKKNGVYGIKTQKLGERANEN